MSLTKAAGELFITQPVLSHSLAYDELCKMIDKFQEHGRDLEAFNALKSLTNVDKGEGNDSGLSTDYWEKKD